MADEVKQPVVRKTGPRTAIEAAATPTLVYIVPTGRTAQLKKVMAYNGQPADITLEVGDGAGAAWVRRLPRMRVVAGFQMNLGEDECPEWDFGPANDIYAQASAAGAGALAVEVQVVVEES